jgi:hypothetical protein
VIRDRWWFSLTARELFRAIYCTLSKGSPT